MESVTIELRPRLQSCNVFIALAEGTDPNRIRIKLNKDYITLRIGQESYNLCLSTIRIIPTSLSCLKVSGGWLSFRIQTTPTSLFGSFGTELLDASSMKDDNCRSTFSSIELPPKGSDITIYCNCCKNVLTNTINLKKVLPLPDPDCDPSEWFCCTHGGDDYSKLLDPGPSDYFYGPYYSVLNRKNFVPKLITNVEAVVCNRCLAILGKPQSDNCLKIWNCCVQYGSVDNSSNEHGEPLRDFEAAVISSMDGFHNERILLEASECGKTRYLLIKPMEWNLNLLVAPEKTWDVNAIRLDAKNVVKIFYDYGESRKTLKNDHCDDKYCEIAMISMLAGLELLVSSSKRIPPIYRNVDELHIGYMNFRSPPKNKFQSSRIKINNANE